MRAFVGGSPRRVRDLFNAGKHKTSAVVTWLEQDWVEHVRKRQHIMLLGKQSRQENSATDTPRVQDGMDVPRIL